MRKQGKVVIILLTLGVAVMGAATASGAAKSGTVQLPKDMTIDLGFSLTGTGNPAVLPRGGYNLEHWTLRRTDEQGTMWTCGGSPPSGKKVLRIVQDQETQLPVGEPLVATLTATRCGSEYTFTHDLQGRLGEAIRIDKNGERVPPKVRIKNADGSYDQSLTFGFT